MLIQCKEKSIPYYVFILPYEYQIRNDNLIGIFKPQDILKKLLFGSEIKVIDCSQAFINFNGNYKDLYLYGDADIYERSGTG